MTQRIHSLDDLVVALNELSVAVDEKHEETTEKAHALVTFLVGLKQGGVDRGLDSEFLEVFFAGIDRLVEQRPFGDVISDIFDETVAASFETPNGCIDARSIHTAFDECHAEDADEAPAECHIGCDDPLCPYTHPSGHSFAK